jgi:hypothetical protein
MAVAEPVALSLHEILAVSFLKVELGVVEMEPLLTAERAPRDFQIQGVAVVVQNLKGLTP